MSEEHLERYTYLIEEGEEGERIDRYLAEQEEDWSRSQIQKWLKEERVKVNGVKVKANYRVAVGDEILLLVPPPEALKVLPEAIPLQILYEDRDLVVVNKPRGMVVHPAPGNSSGTLVNALLYHVKDLSGINGILRPGIVHRIDKETSGLLVVAKSDRAHLGLAAQLKEHAMERSYLAVVNGHFPHRLGTVDAPIGRDPRDRKKMAVDPKGKHAVTHFSVVEELPKHTLLRCRLETGRTHQIRVHMSYIGHPIVGDPKYGKGESYGMEGQALHAATLGFIHPVSGEFLHFEAPLPEDMVGLLERLRSM
ncbi:pseudouridylate synthase [[Clostridium] ultunense Esp]|nr:pseudouridylate synthase [[Clostridium] ultunense Esp]